MNRRILKLFKRDPKDRFMTRKQVVYAFNAMFDFELGQGRIDKRLMHVIDFELQEGRINERLMIIEERLFGGEK